MREGKAADETRGSPHSNVQQEANGFEVRRYDQEVGLA